MKWDKVEITNEKGEIVSAQAPVIISASRSTDIPAFYSEWFIHRLKKGYLAWKNPFNGQTLYVSFKNTRIIVFWSKNPKPILKYLDFLNEKQINYYFQFTLNDYDQEKFERYVPNVENRIETFIKLSEKIGKEKVIWRFDPYILTESIDVDELLKRTEYIGNQINKYTEKLVFSYADIKTYKKVQNNLRKESVPYQEFNQRTMEDLASGLAELNKNWGLELSTCSEKIDLKPYGITHNKCIDDDLMVRLFPNDNKLMEFIGYEEAPIQGSLFDNKSDKITYNYKIKKDKGQRALCGCIMSKDIGLYNTCPFGCIYCYAVTSHELAVKNYNKHKQNPISETITGE